MVNTAASFYILECVLYLEILQFEFFSYVRKNLSEDYIVLMESGKNFSLLHIKKYDLYTMQMKTYFLWELIYKTRYIVRGH